MRDALLAVQDQSTRNDLIAKGLLRAAGFTWRKMADSVERALVKWSLQG
jgi:hypothetical protein